MASHRFLLATLLPCAAWAAVPLALSSGDAHTELIRRYVTAMQAARAAGRCAEVDLTIQAALPRLNRHAELRAARRTNSTGAISYRPTGSTGDGLVRRQVIGSYLAADSEAQTMDGIAITPAHYRFHFLRTFEDSGRPVQVFQLSPRQKRPGLFKGELWLDGQTALPVRESGQFVRSPSVFVKRVAFVRDYRLQGDLAIPQRISATVETRLAGRAELSVEFGEIARLAGSLCE